MRWRRLLRRQRRVAGRAAGYAEHGQRRGQREQVARGHQSHHAPSSAHRYRHLVMEHADAVVTVRVPAKLNLVLAVGPARSDGYHELATVFHAVSLYDTVEARPAAEITVVVTGERAAGVPTGSMNLAARAAAELRRATGVRAGVRLNISKR